MKVLNIQGVCLRCGYITTFEIALTGKEDTAIYKCKNCNFIICHSWFEDHND